MDRLTAENESLEKQTEQLLKQLEDVNDLLVKYELAIQNFCTKVLRRSTFF